MVRPGSKGQVYLVLVRVMSRSSILSLGSSASAWVQDAIAYRQAGRPVVSWVCPVRSIHPDCKHMVQVAVDSGRSAPSPSSKIRLVGTVLNRRDPLTRVREACWLYLPYSTSSGYKARRLISVRLGRPGLSPLEVGDSGRMSRRDVAASLAFEDAAHNRSNAEEKVDGHKSEPTRHGYPSAATAGSPCSFLVLSGSRQVGSAVPRRGLVVVASFGTASAPER